MLCGFLPFIGIRETQTVAKIINRELEFIEGEWIKVSQEAKDFLRLLLDKDPNKRPVASEVLFHPWIQSNMQGSSNKVCLDSVKNLISFKSQLKIQQATFEFIVSHLSTQSELKKLQSAFVALDANGDGKLSREEIMLGINKINCKKVFDVEKIIEECDADGSDFIDYSEFLTATMNWQKNLSRKKIETAFRTFDVNGDEKIDLAELKGIIGGALNEDMYQEIMKEADANGDGWIDFKEFEQVCMRSLF